MCGHIYSGNSHKGVERIFSPFIETIAAADETPIRE